MADLGTLGRYRLIRRLAAGGMGEVYLAELPGVANFSQRVAIKRILPHLARDSDFVDKFIDEAVIMMRLHHGNIVGVHELADQDGELYIVMEYLPGRDLKAVTRRLRERRQLMPTDLALWLVGEICAALDYAHRRTDEDGAPMHIVHRDVSPSNVLIGAAGEVKLLDFGIARARGKLHQSVSGTLQGKFVYMSPEQADGRKVDGRSDIYSAGLVLYELLCGLRPFEGESETETLRKVRSGVVEAPSVVRPDLPGELDALVMRALARAPDDRYPTAAAMGRALQLYLADTRSHADAQQLSAWLATLFPEGVVAKHGPSGPMSIEDALELQLGALTPNIDPMTRTQTADAGTPSARLLSAPRPGADQRGVPTDPVEPGSLASGALVSGSQPAYSPAHPALISGQSVPAASLPPAILASGDAHRAIVTRGRKRSFVFAVLLGALLATAALLWWLNRPAATIKPIVPGVETFSVRKGIDGPELLAGVELPVGEAIELCVVADGYAPACKLVTLADGVNQPRFALKAVPEVELVVVPGDAPAGFTIDGVPAERGRNRIASGVVKICVGEDPPGWRLAANQTRCISVQGEPGVARRIERAFEMIPDAAPPPVKDAGAPPSVADASPPTSARPHIRPRPRIARHRISVEPAGATLVCGDARYTQFPARIDLTHDQRCTASASGLAPRTISLSGKTGSRQTIELEAFGRLFARAAPGAARLFVNGKQMRGSVIRNHPVPPGEVRLEMRFTEDGRVYTARKTVTVAPGKEANTSLCVKTKKTDYCKPKVP